MDRLAAARPWSRKVADFSDEIMLKINGAQAVFPSTADESPQATSWSASGTSQISIAEFIIFILRPVDGLARSVLVRDRPSGNPSLASMVTDDAATTTIAPILQS
jgi:hypothetical protein